jgi:hypothetical protein
MSLRNVQQMLAQLINSFNTYITNVNSGLGTEFALFSLGPKAIPKSKPKITKPVKPKGGSVTLPKQFKVDILTSEFETNASFQIPIEGEAILNQEYPRFAGMDYFWSYWDFKSNKKTQLVLICTKDNMTLPQLEPYLDNNVMSRREITTPKNKKYHFIIMKDTCFPVYLKYALLGFYCWGQTENVFKDFLVDLFQKYEIPESLTLDYFGMNQNACDMKQINPFFPLYLNFKLREQPPEKDKIETQVEMLLVKYGAKIIEANQKEALKNVIKQFY